MDAGKKCVQLKQHLLLDVHKYQFKFELTWQNVCWIFVKSTKVISKCVYYTVDLIIGQFSQRYSLDPKKSNFDWFNQWFAFSLSNQSIFTEIISEIWLIYSNLFLAIWISQISLIISRFWLIQIQRVYFSLIYCWIALRKYFG